MKIAKCPWCKSKPRLVHGKFWQWLCENPLCDVQPPTRLLPTREEATIAWNKCIEPMSAKKKKNPNWVNAPYEESGIMETAAKVKKHAKEIERKLGKRLEVVTSYDARLNMVWYRLRQI